MRGLAAAACLLAASIAQGQGFPELPADFRDALAWVPADSQSLVATLKPFQVRRLSTDAKNPSPFVETLRWIVLGGHLPNARLPQDLYALLEGREVVWALSSKRGQEVRTNPGGWVELGIHPYESVSIARFRDSLPAEFIAALQLRPKWIAGGKEWFDLGDLRYAQVQGGNLLVTVSTLGRGKAMLDEVTRRLAAPGERAFESAGPWPLIGLSDTFWGLRRTLEERGRDDDAKNREWVLFSYSVSRPAAAAFRSLLREGADQTQVLRSLGAEQGEVVRKDMGAKTRVHMEGRALQFDVECLPEYRDTCLGLFFLYEAYGVMVWI